MKIVVLFLVLANGLLCMWQAYFVAPDSRRYIPPQTNVPELVTLEETGTTVQALAAVNTPVADEPSSVDQSQSNQAATAGNSVAFVDSAEPFPAAACYSVGPFVDSDALQQAQQLFADNNVEYQQRTFKKQELFGYNVMVSPLATRDEAIAMVKVLVSKGLNDYYVMTEEGFKNAISLGLFKEHRFAVEHLDGVREKGIRAEMKARYVERARHWLDYVENGSSIQHSALQKVSPESAVQKLPRAC